MLGTYEARKADAAEMVKILQMIPKEDQQELAKYLRGAALLAALQRQRENDPMKTA